MDGPSQSNGSKRKKLEDAQQGTRQVCVWQVLAPGYLLGPGSAFYRSGNPGSSLARACGHGAKERVSAWNLQPRDKRYHVHTCR